MVDLSIRVLVTAQQPSAKDPSGLRIQGTCRCVLKLRKEADQRRRDIEPLSCHREPKGLYGRLRRSTSIA